MGLLATLSKNYTQHDDNKSSAISHEGLICINDNQHDDTRYNDIQYNGFICDTEQNYTQLNSNEC